MVLALDGSAKGNGGTTSASCTLTTTSTNDIIYVVVTAFGNTASPTINTPTATGLTFNLRKSNLTAASAIIGTYYAVAASAQSAKVISVTTTNTTGVVIIAFGISGANTATPFDANAAIPATTKGTTSAVSVTFSTSNANDFIILGVADDSGVVGTKGNIAGAASTLIFSQNETVNFNDTGSAEYLVVSSTETSQTALFTTGTPVFNWSAVVDAVVQASAAVSSAPRKMAVNPKMRSYPARLRQRSRKWGSTPRSPPPSIIVGGASIRKDGRNSQRW